jgi:hypothetical protein
MYDKFVFTMKGGTISGNQGHSGGGALFFRGKGSVITMEGGEISGNTASAVGGGVYVHDNSSFTKTGNSVIYGNDASNELKNTAGADDKGHAVYVKAADNSTKKRDKTADKGDNLDSSKSNEQGGGWD